MQNRFTIKIAFALCLLLGSCSKGQESDPTPPKVEEGTMSFSVDVTATRGVSASTENISEFGVFCFDTEYALWENAKTTATPNKMNNQRVDRREGAWVYDPPVMWDGGDGTRFTFFAYSPYATGARTEENPAGNGVTIKTVDIPMDPDTGPTDGPTEKIEPGSLVLQYSPLKNADEQVDLLVANQMQDLRAQSSVKVKFSHALVKVGFKAYSNTNGMRIDSIVISGTPDGGEYDLYTGRWTTISATTEHSYIFAQTTYINTDADNPSFVSDPSNYFMLLPKDYTTNSTAKITFYFSDNTSMQRSKPYTIKENWQVANAYIYTVELNADNPSEDLFVEGVEVIPWDVDATTPPFSTGKTFELKLYPNDGTGDGGLGTPEISKRPAGSFRELPTLADRDPLLFKGWNTAPDGTGKHYAPGAKYRMGAVDGDYKLYAQWKEPEVPGVEIGNMIVAIDDEADTYNWQNAIDACIAKTPSGWRLPTISELQEIYDYHKTAPTLTNNTYWSISEEHPNFSVPEGSACSFYVGSSIDYGGLADASGKEYTLYVRCVRDK